VLGFNGLRVLSFESRRAKEIAQLIQSNGGVPTVAPSTREVPELPSEDELQIIRGVVAGGYEIVIFMTGVGARALIDVGRTVYPAGEFESALARAKIIVRGPKPAAVMREFKVPYALTAPEPNTWREVIDILDQNRDSVPISGCRIAVQEHGEPSQELYEALRIRGAEVVPVRVYRWELPEDIGPLQDAVHSVCSEEADVVLFTSSVQLTHALKVAEDLKLGKQFRTGLNHAVIASIGPVASAALRAHGIAVDFEPSHPKMGFLVKEAAEWSAGLLRAKSSPSDHGPKS
jgi:uroporphyrinogen-III synthase